MDAFSNWNAFMCLTVKLVNKMFPTPQVAAEDIFVFKALDKANPHFEETGWISAFRGEPYTLDKVIHSSLSPSNSGGIYLDQHTETLVGPGLHTFGDLASFEDVFTPAWRSCKDVFPFVAVIPKGALYHHGVFEGTENCYASNMLKVLPHDHPESVKRLPEEYRSALTPEV